MVNSAVKKERIAHSIRGVPNFPKPGILFWDITTLLLDPIAFQDTLDLFIDRYRSQNIEGIAGEIRVRISRDFKSTALEARGFIFGAPLAAALKVPLILMRKPNKLPGDKISQSYDLEYGSDTIEMHSDAVKPGQRVIIVDDLIATGGTMKASIDLLQRAGATIVEAAVIIELPDLKGKDKLGTTPLFVLIQKEGL
eukprot:g2880.t1